MARHDNRRPRRPTHEPTGLFEVPPVEQSEVHPELLQTLRAGLRSRDPLDLLGWVSAMVEVGEPRSAPWPDEPDDSVSLDQLVDAFEGVPCSETTAALRIIRAFTRDTDLRTRLDRILARRRHHLPLWLSHLGEARVSGDVLLLTHALGDGDDCIFGVRLADGQELTVVVYIDHNLNGAVKDGFVIPEPLRSVTGRFVDILDGDQRLEVTDPAVARAVIEDAMGFGATFVPPMESETWPVCRPLVEWAVRLLPSGGSVPERRQWTDDELTQIADDFFAHDDVRGLDTADRRSLLDLVLRFAVDDTGGDPLRWSPVNLAILLGRWVPEKVLADVSLLAQLPELLAAWVPYAHRVRGISATLTGHSMAALADLTPGYLDAIEDMTPVLDLSPGTVVLGLLTDAVGGHEQLAALDVAPLPDEPFDWAGVPEDVHGVVAAWLDLCDRCADALFDAEHRTVFRRFLARVAASDPAIFRRATASPVRGAAALVWAASRANRSVGWNGTIAVKDLMAWFGLSGSVAQRAEPLLRALGLSSGAAVDGLGSPDLLVSDRRATIIADRDRWAMLQAADH